MTEWRATDYYKHSSLQAAMAAEVLDRLSLAGDERVLDVGCGDGKITAEIASRVPRGSVLGIDPSRDMIEFATRHFGPPAYGNLHFEVADARRIEHTSEFDLVVSFNALHWVRDLAAALRAIHAGLKPTGQARLRFVCQGPRTSLEDVIEEVRRQPRWASSFEGFEPPFVHPTPEAFRALAERCAFRALELHVEDKAWNFGSRTAFARFAEATFVEWTRRLPQDQWPAFIADVLDRYRLVAADELAENDTFKFYQLQVVLAPVR